MRSSVPGKRVRVSLSSCSSQPCDGVVVGVACGSEDAYPEDSPFGVGEDIGVGLQECAEVSSRSLFLALLPGHGRHHPGFGAVGDHAQDVEPVPFPGRQGIEGLIVSEILDADMLRGLLAFLLQGLDPGFECLLLGLQLSDFPEDCVGGFGLAFQFGDPVAERAECLPAAAQLAVPVAPVRVDDLCVRILGDQTVHRQGVEVEFFPGILEDLKAQQYRARLVVRIREFFEHHDALCLPTLPVAAPAFGETDLTVGARRISAQDAMTVMPWIANLTGLPAVSVPSGRNAAGLPVALTLMGRPFGEEAILDMAATFQSVTDWHTLKPGMVT